MITAKKGFYHFHTFKNGGIITQHKIQNWMLPSRLPHKLCQETIIDGVTEGLRIWRSRKSIPIDIREVEIPENYFMMGRHITGILNQLIKTLIVFIGARRGAVNATNKETQIIWTPNAAPNGITESIVIVKRKSFDRRKLLRKLLGGRALRSAAQGSL